MLADFELRSQDLLVLAVFGLLIFGTWLPEKGNSLAERLFDRHDDK